MNTPIRPALVVAVVFLLAVCIFGLRLACDPGGLREIIQEDHRKEELDEVLRATSRRDEARQQVVRELIDRRCTLAEALERYEELDREVPDSIMEGLEERLRQSNKERRFRSILEKVEGILHDRPEELSEVIRCLEKEHQQLQADIPATSSVPTEPIEPSR